MKHKCLLPCLLAFAAAPLTLGCTVSSDQFPPKEGPLQELSYTPASSHFSLWAPTADSARVLLYEEGLGGQPYVSLTAPGALSPRETSKAGSIPSGSMSQAGGSRRLPVFSPPQSEPTGSGRQ